MSALVSAATATNRHEAVANNPCPVHRAVVEQFADVKITADFQVDRASFIGALQHRGFSPLLCKVLNGALEKASKANGKDGTSFTGDDVRGTAFFDGLSTGIFRSGYDAQRFETLIGASGKSFGTSDIATMVRALRKEQNASIKALLFTLFEYSAVRYAMAGAKPVAIDDMRAFFAEGRVTDHFGDPNAAKTVPGILGATIASGAALLFQSAIHATLGYYPTPDLSLSAPAVVAEGARSACPFHRFIGKK